MDSDAMSEGPSLWGGFECSVIRIKNNFRDQLELTGHAKHIEDLNLIPELGLQTVRYPLLWERVVGYSDRKYDWSWSDERVARLIELNVTPIIGLLHHGSGPLWTSLVDPDFPKHFADFAYEVASRYPFLSHFTPINEPLTTARFSGLYGHWYPHARCDKSFATILLNECEATIKAMEAIRTVNPFARLVQTEDLGAIMSTPPLRYQAEFENHRRWLSIDILCGKLTSAHPLLNYLQDRCGINDRKLEEFQKNTCSPDILGFNHYITSNRFLDHRISHYPPKVHGTNGKDTYADVEAVRVDGKELVTIEDLLTEASSRYGLPLAITETYLSCTPEEQVRWLARCWEAACNLKTKIDIRGMTAWAILGMYDWDTLMLESNGNYEPGIYSIHSGKPAPTMLSEAVKEIVASGQCISSCRSEKGWWERDERIEYRPDQILLHQPR